MELYPHIPNYEGLEALRKAINDGGAEIPGEYLFILVKLILENNYSELNYWV